MGTLDSHLVSLDRKTGSVIWDVPVGELTLAQPITLAPLLVKDKVIVGVAGGDFASRGFIDAYNVETGERAWRFWAVPGAGEPGFETWPNAEAASRGGGSVWVTGTYDPALNLVYFGTGNPNPDYYGDDRLGDNLYTARLSRSMPTPASCGGTISSRPICTTGIPTTFPCSPISRWRLDPQGRDDGESQRFLLHAGPGDREAAREQALHRQLELVEGDRRGRPPGRLTTSDTG